jgi:DNA repair exonuclease SbcCD ATPase subunit
MNLRRVVASLALDGGAYVRQLETERDYYQSFFLAEQARCRELLAQIETHGRAAAAAKADAQKARAQYGESERCHARKLEMVTARAGDWQKSALNLLAQRDGLNRELRSQIAQNGELAQKHLELRGFFEVAESAATSYRSAWVELERQLEEEREQHAATAARAVTRINALESENDELRARIEAPRDEQLDLVPSPEAPERKPEVVLDVEVEKVYLFAKIVFIDGHKWFFRDGGNEAFHAPILDVQFLSRVARREIAFTSGDAVRVRLHQVTTRLGNELKTKCEVLKVIEILPPPPEQTNLLPEASAVS